ncbi:haloalkane dehalogenase [Sorangium sp. So ce363]|uniref:haloalkane dehalogenase n=1 Tax=Sorangium sp. So ce363 TaxID=3133304 RepID=UPI003F631B25
MGTSSKKRVCIEGHEMAYVDQGMGEPVVFLHGNPTSSYLWRNILGPTSARRRCLAPDLIGMGDSDKLPETGRQAYGYATHARFLDAWFDAVVPAEPVVLVVHDWGSALGFDWARRHPDRVRGVAYMEAIVGSMPLGKWPAAAREFFEAIRSDAGEELVLEQNVFLERVISEGSMLRPLSDEERAEYRRPFLVPGEERRPTLSWPRLLPFDGEPKAICALADAYVAWLTASSVPKLFVNAEPGRILTGELREICRRFPNQREVTVRGLHYPQEDSPMEIADALAGWLDTLAPPTRAQPVAS